MKGHFANNFSHQDMHCRGWSRWPLKVPFNWNYFVILCFYDRWNLHHQLQNSAVHLQTWKTEFTGAHLRSFSAMWTDQLWGKKKKKITSVDLLYDLDQEKGLQGRLWPARRLCLNSIFWYSFSRTAYWELNISYSSEMVELLILEALPYVNIGIVTESVNTPHGKFKAKWSTSVSVKCFNQLVFLWAFWN